MSGPLSGLRLLDITHYSVGPFACTLLAQMGMDVVKIESPEGDHQSRTPPPFKNGITTTYNAMNSGKRCAVFDLRDEAVRETIFELVRQSDILIENHRPGFLDRRGLGWDDVHKLNPSLVYCSSSGYGSRGPYKQMGSVDTYGQAVSGFASVSGVPGERPEGVKGGAPADLGTSQYIVAGVLAALYRRDMTGIGQFVDTSQMQATSALSGARASEYFVSGEIPTPMGSGVNNICPSRAYKAEDGKYVALSALDEPTWQRLCATLNLGQLASDPKLQSNAGRVANREIVDAAIEGAIATQSAAQWIAALTGRGVPAAPFMTHNNLRISEQVREQEMIQDVVSPWGRITIGGMPWRFSRTPGWIRPAHKPGQDNEEILREFTPKQVPAPPVEVDGSADGTHGPLEGLRVVDITQGYVGYAGMLMADAGATVIKVEPPEGDYLRKLGGAFAGDTAAAFLAVNRSKQSVRLDWQNNPAARAALDRMLMLADVLITDLQPSVAKQHGLTEEALRPSHGRLIITSLTPFGDTGPIADQPATELEVQAMSGQWRYLGDYGAAPVRHGLPIGAVNSSVFAFQGTLGALHERMQSGKGQKVECSQLGAELTMQSILWAAESEPDDWEGHTTAIKREPARGYKTRTVSILWGFMADQPAMDEFCKRLGFTEEFARGDAWQVDKARPIFEKAFEDHDADEIIGWVRELGGNAVHYHNFATFAKDPQVEALGLVNTYDYPGIGKVGTMGLAWEFSASPTDPGRPPLLGEHTDAVLKDIGYSEADIAAMA